MTSHTVVSPLINRQPAFPAGCLTLITDRSILLSSSAHRIHIACGSKIVQRRVTSGMHLFMRRFQTTETVVVAKLLPFKTVVPFPADTDRARYFTVYVFI